MIDWARVSELRTDMGEEDFHEVIELFLAEVEEKLDELRASDGPPNAADLHFLRGSSANVGFSDLMRLCLAAERGEQALDTEMILSCYAASKEVFMEKTAAGAF